MNIAEQVKKDCAELAKLGVISKSKLARINTYIDTNAAEIEGYRNSGMKIAEISNLVEELV